MARLSFYKLVYRKDYIKMVKSEYIIKNIVDNEYDPMLLELESIGSGNTLFLELNETTITTQLQLDIIKAYFDESGTDKTSLDSSAKVLRMATRHYIDEYNEIGFTFISDEFELHAIVQFDDDGYTLLDITSGC